MTPRKTLLTAAMAAGLLLGATACGSDDNGGDDDDTSVLDNSNADDADDDDSNDDDGDDDGDSGEDLASRDGDEIAADALEATQSLDAVTIAGEIEQDGERIALDANFTTEGTCQGAVTVEGMEIEFLSVDGGSYFKYGSDFWETQGPEGAQMAEAIGDNWLAAPAGQEDEFEMFCSLDNLLNDMDMDDPQGADIEVAEGETVEGVDTIELIEDSSDGEVRIFVVDDPDEPFIAKISHETEGEMVFSNFNEEPDVQAPAPDEVMEMEDLEAAM